MIRALAIAATAAGVIACTPWKDAGVAPTQTARTQAAAASGDVAQACGPFGSKQHGGTDGTSRADYDCEGPSK
jgi:hypothetical protein